MMCIALAAGTIPKTRERVPANNYSNFILKDIVLLLFQFKNATGIMEDCCIKITILYNKKTCGYIPTGLLEEQKETYPDCYQE